MKDLLSAKIIFEHYAFVTCGSFYCNRNETKIHYKQIFYPNLCELPVWLHAWFSLKTTPGVVQHRGEQVACSTETR